VTEKGLASKVLDDAVKVAVDVFKTDVSEIKDITILKTGMTNDSFSFVFRGQKYIMRVPGTGTEMLINRAQEYAVYMEIKDKEICEDVFYIDSDSGYKITRYIENAKNCDGKSAKEIAQCMSFLREMHERNLKVGHTFAVFEEIERYEKLRKGVKSCYEDYEETKKFISELQDYIETQPKQWGLAHIDAVPDNFLFFTGQNGKKEIRLIDWEYAGMQDQHIDIAMFAIYAMYNQEEIDRLIDYYFIEGCEKETRRKIYAYISICGLLWSNWCEYKHLKGVEFGEYAECQYKYAREYYKLWKEME